MEARKEFFMGCYLKNRLPRPEGKVQIGAGGSAELSAFGKCPCH